jgi:hypothetical protein
MRPTYFGLGFLVLVLAALGAGPQARKLSVAQILAEGNKLDGATIEVHGNVNLSREISSFSDDSKCSGARKEPCKLSLTIGKCRVSGVRYAGLQCDEAVLRITGEAGFPITDPTPLLITNMVVVGRLSTTRAAVAAARRKKWPPAPGFGHFGIFQAQLSAIEINFDKAVVKPLQ